MLPLWVSAGHLGFQGDLFISMLPILCSKASRMLSAGNHINRSILKNFPVLLSQQTKHQLKNQTKTKPQTNKKKNQKEETQTLKWQE